MRTQGHLFLVWILGAGAALIGAAECEAAPPLPRDVVSDSASNSDSISRETSSADADLDAAAIFEPDQLLVLKSGRLVEGRISRNAGGYLVEMPKGSMLVPASQVRFAAAGRHDAYRKLRAAMPERTATNHLSLARWCLTHQLVRDARREIQDALYLEPDREEARTMLRRLDQGEFQGGSVTVGTESASSSSTEALRTPDGFEAADVQSLAGLSRSAAQQFVHRIQPILLNKCGNASCHGPTADNDFQLTPMRRGHRVLAERNLAAAFRYIDLEDPESSPLLILPQASHGRGGRSIFHGARGSDQLDELREWVAQISRERSPSRPSDRNHPSLVETRNEDDSRTLRTEPIQTGHLGGGPERYEPAPLPDTISGPSPGISNRTGAVNPPFNPVEVLTNAVIQHHAQNHAPNAGSPADVGDPRRLVEPEPTDSPEIVGKRGESAPVRENSRDAFDPGEFNSRFGMGEGRRRKR